MSKALFTTFILDESGSMGSIKSDTIGGFNEFLHQNQKEGGDDWLFTLIKFDSNRHTVAHNAVPIRDVPDLTDETYLPGAATPLVDACVKAIKATEEKVTDGQRVSIVIQTDGKENASTEYTNKDLAALVKEKTEAGWMFTFLGAGMDAFAQAAEFGISADDTLRYGRDKSAAAFAATAARNTTYGATGQSVGFSTGQREAARDEHEVPAPAKQRSGKQRPAAVDDIKL